ncbi:hypothetical protein [Acidovorax radicis]|uniref:hypothetical protein n=1 Tax=Acidovorax radicis TaxID=758826 RepID=UPI001CF81B51|nr:hypothetical protein [Acidovorax radicis]UCU97305.1 hypothetical protein KI609_11810 [Acidovorax radicis]
MTDELNALRADGSGLLQREMACVQPPAKAAIHGISASKWMADLDADGRAKFWMTLWAQRLDWHGFLAQNPAGHVARLA